MNQLFQAVIFIILAVFTLLVIIYIINPEFMQGILGGAAEQPPLIRFTERPDIDVVYSQVGSSYHYDITVDGVVEHSGEMENFGQLLPEINVIPVIDFKGDSQKASVNGNLDPFEVAKDNRKYSGSFAVTDIISRDPPAITMMQDSYDGVMEEDVVFLFTNSANNNLSLELVDVRQFKAEYTLGPWGIDSVVTVEIPIIEGETDCQAVFNINCGESEEAVLVDNCNSIDKTHCDKYIEMCNGVVHIKANAVDCTNKEATILLEFFGGMEYEAGDTIGISFWRNDNACVRDSPDYGSLSRECADYFLGREMFKVVPHA